MKKENCSITTYINCIKTKLPNRRIKLYPNIDQDDKEGVLVEFQILDSSKKEKAFHSVSHNGKVINTGIYISRAAAEALMASIHVMLKQWDGIEKTKVKTK